MKIGLVLANAPAYSETFFINKIRGLQQNGHSIALFIDKPLPTFQLCQQYVAPSVPANKWLRLIKAGLFTLHFRLFYPTRYKNFLNAEQKTGRNRTEAYKNLYRSMHLLKFSDLDWVHFGFATMALGRENVAEVIGAKMAVSFRGYDISIYPVKHPGCYHLLWQKVNKIHTISNDLLDEAYNLGLPRHKPVTKITPAINVEYFSTDQSSAVLHDPLRIVTVARLHWKKGLEYTLQALAMLKDRGIEFRYTIIGDGSEYERLAFAAYQIGIRDWVAFVGKVPHEQVKTHLSESDLYIQYSIQEGFCNAVLEAQAMGLLCIVSDAEGLPENVLHEKSGWVVPKRQPKQLVAQILRVLQLDERKLLEIRQFAMQRVCGDFNQEKQIYDFSKFYQP